MAALSPHEPLIALRPQKSSPSAQGLPFHLVFLYSLSNTSIVPVYKGIQNPKNYVGMGIFTSARDISDEYYQ